MKWNDEKWSDNDNHELTLVRAAEDGAVVVDGAGRDVKEGDLFVHSGSDTVGVYSVNEDDLRNDGFTPDGEPETNTGDSGGTDESSDDQSSESSDDDHEDDDHEPHPAARKRTVPRKRA